MKLCLFLIIVICGFVKSQINFQCEEKRLFSYYNNNKCTIQNLNATQLTKFIYVTDHYRDIKLMISNMTFVDCSLTYIPYEVFRHYKNIIFFDISRSGVVDMPATLFEEATNLKFLNISRNSLNELKDTVFFGAEKLSTIDLSYNRLEKIDEYAFRGLVELQVLDLSVNYIKKLVIHTFSQVPGLKLIKLNNNRLEVMGKEIFERNVYLVEIDLSNNNLMIFDSVSITHLSYLRNADFSFNQLTEFISYSTNLRRLTINNNLLIDITFNHKLEYLNAANNKIHRVYVENDNCKEVYLSNNSINDIKNVTKLVNLSKLDLSFNRIGKIPLSTFSTLKKLKMLYLEATNISGLDFGTFSHQSELLTLDLSYNGLKKIDLNIFSSLINLEFLFIDGNGLTDILYEDIDQILPILNIIGLSNNNWNCTHLSKIVKKLNSKSIKMYVDPDNHIHSTTNIRGIGCSNDKLTEVEIKQLERPTANHTNVNGQQMDDTKNEINMKISSVAQKIAETQISDGNTQLQLADLNKKFIEFDKLKEELIQMRLFFESKTSNSSSSDDQRLNNLIKKNEELTNKLNILNQKFYSLENIDSKSRVVEQASLKVDADIRTGSTDVQLIKILVTLIFIAGVVFIIFKIVKFVKIRRRLSFRKQSFETGSTLTEIEHEV